MSNSASPGSHSSGGPSESQSARRTKETLHAKFSSAAAALTDLYKESTDAYEAGYRDALLYVHRYVLLTAVRSEHTGGAPTTGPLSSPSTATAAPLTEGPSLSPHSVVAAEKFLRFVGKTIQRRRDRVALERGSCEGRRRPREEEADDVEYGMHDLLLCRDSSSDEEVGGEVAPVLGDNRQPGHGGGVVSLQAAASPPAHLSCPRRVAGAPWVGEEDACDREMGQLPHGAMSYGGGAGGAPFERNCSSNDVAAPPPRQIRRCHSIAAFEQHI